MNNENKSDYISKLPHHILEKIFMHVKNIDHYCKLYEVCKEFRNVIYFKRTAFIFHLDALTMNSELKFMPNLKKLTITAMNSFQEIALLRVVDLFSWIWIPEFKSSCIEKKFSGKLIVFSIYCSSFTCSVISIAVCVLWWGYCRTTEMCSWTDQHIEILWHSVQFRKCFR